MAIIIADRNYVIPTNIDSSKKNKHTQFSTEKCNEIDEVDSEVSNSVTSLLVCLRNYEKFNLSKDKSHASFSNHLLKQELVSFNVQLSQYGAYDNSAFNAEIEDIAKQYNSECIQAGASQLEAPFERKPFVDQICNIIDTTKLEYYDAFERALAKYIEYYKKFSDIVAKMSSYIHSVDDEGQLRYDFMDLKTSLIELQNDYTEHSENNILYPKNWDDRVNVTHEDALKWTKDMGLPNTCIKTITDKITGKIYYVINIDPSPLQTMIDNIKHGDKNNYKLSNTEYQAWLTGFNAQEDQIKTTVQSLTGRYGNA
ncbi:IpaD/SipD/SspD family type III secretion system needle tip protein, partial [Serratia sp. M24T3]|uniref:IpaD/SipD/SspD family type III secretion system needle tip protein n=1 Tax=Serratia sp. M24T3 TaxID=932213 RepID=UPI00025BC0CC